MDALRISAAEEVEALLIDYFESGAIDHAKLAEPLARYASHADALRARDAAWAFMERARWETALSDNELLREAGELVALAGSMDVATATAAHGQIERISGGAEVAARLIDAWISEFGARSVGQSFDLDVSMIRGAVHPKLMAALTAAGAGSNRLPSLFEACSKIAIPTGLGQGGGRGHALVDSGAIRGGASASERA